MEAMFDKETQQAMDMLDEAIAEVETEVEAEAHPETAAPDPFEGKSSVSAAVAEDDEGTLVLCWHPDTWRLTEGNVVTFREDSNKSLHLIKKALGYVNAEALELFASILPVFRVDSYWFRSDD